MNRFYEGQEIQSIRWESVKVTVGKNNVKKIIVSMESGQADYVHWFEVTYNGGKVLKYNGALVEGCELKQQEATDESTE